MSTTKQRLTTALLRHGQTRLAELWDVDATEVGRRLNNHRGIKLADLAQAIDALGIELVTPDDGDQVILPRDEYEALRTLARKALDRHSAENE